jgi:protein involved in polysaccharide export with SLBB domain
LGFVSDFELRISNLLSGFAARVGIFVGACILLAGCGDRIRPPSPEELARFQATEQAHPMVDMDRVLQAKIVTGPYRAVAGDVLHVEMPKFPEQPSPMPGTDNRQIYNCRIAEDGTIVLPIVGPLAVQGKSLAEIEGAIAARYYPQYVATPLLVYVSVQEYRTEQVSIVGAVTQPGIHALRHDQMSLVALLMQAGGIAAPGAAVIRINRATEKAGREENGDVLPILNPSSAGVSSGWQAVFEREGPLRTTGWLRVEQENGRASVRKWLDIANVPQRREFLGALASQPPGLRTEDLMAKLVQLSAYLEELPQQSALPTQAPPGWQVREGRFVAVADGWAGDGDASSRMVAARRSIDDGYAVGSARQGAAPRTRDARPRPQPAVQAPRSSGSDPQLAPGTANLPMGSLETAPRKSGRPGLPPTANQERGGPSVGVPTPRPAPSPERPPRAPDAALDPQEHIVQTAGIQTLVLPVRGLNIPFADVVLEEGDTVVVEPPREQSVSVLGLVARPGNLPYPPGARYTLVQAIAFAGGLDLIADPRYVSVYRLAPDGQVVSATFQLVNPHRQQQLTDVLALPLKPGDVVSVEHTPRTRTNVFFDRVFRISLGLYLTPEGLWNGN